MVSFTLPARSRARRRDVGALAAALGALLATPAAWAQTGSPPFNQNVDVQLFRPAPGSYSFLTVEGSRVDGHLSLSVGAWANYGWRPLTIYTAECPNAENNDGCQLGAVRSRPIEHQATLDAIVTLTLSRRVLLALDLPVTYLQGDAVNAADATPVGGAGNPQSRSSFALGDPRISARVRILGEGLQGFGLAASVSATVPTGQFTGGEQNFAADDSVTLGGKVIADWRRGRMSLAANVGVLWRPDTIQVLSTRFGTRLTYGAALGVRLTSRFTGIAEVFGNSDFSGLQQAAALEGDLAVRYSVGDVAITLGGGAGFIRGAGSPAARGFLGFTWAPYRVDTDHDGVQDNVDRCVGELEDVDGYEDDDGCLDNDNDGDGREDSADRCPNEAEDRDGFQDDDGCPDPDNDNDGVPDGYDTCPTQQEDRDGDHDDDGCPDNDRDRDGIPDDHDRCPTDAEDVDGFADEDGCPEPDNDRDGILDVNDQCSEQAETMNGIDDTDGCPDSPPDRDHDGIPDDRDRCTNEPETFNGTQDDDGCADGGAYVTLEGERMIAHRAVHFARRGDDILGGDSFRVLDAVVSLLRIHPELRAVEVRAYTDERGTPDGNRQLSQRRADVVRYYLIAQGVDEHRVTARGFGSDEPAHLETDRRVQFYVSAAPPAQSPAAQSPAAPPTR